MKIITRTITILALAAAALATIGISSCSKGKSYAELLADESKTINAFLANQRVCNEIPADTVFECGPDAPYYRMDEEGNIYMQVLNPGTPGNMAKSDQQIFFRFTRYNLQNYKDGKLPEGTGNEDDMSFGETSFRFGNYSLQSSYQWGSGLQTPLNYLPIDCQVNLVIKSQYGLYSETSYVVPYLYSVRYYPRRS